MLSDFDREPIWNIIYQPSMVPVLVGRKRKHVIELIGALAVNGPSTTRELSRVVLSRTHGKVVRDKDARIREQIYYKLLEGRKGSKSYSGLVERGYVVNAGRFLSKTKSIAKTYFLDLKGCFLALGYEFNDVDLRLFIKLAALNHPFFAYIDTILEKTSLKFVSKTFIEPIKRLIRKGQIFLNEDVSIYFGFIADQIEKTLFDHIEVSLEWSGLDSSSMKFKEKIGPIDILSENTWFDINANQKREWTYKMTNLYYPKDNLKQFYTKYGNQLRDFEFLYKVMRAVHFAYYAFFSQIPPRHIQKLKVRSRFKKYHYPPNKNLITASELVEYQKSRKKTKLK